MSSTAEQVKERLGIAEVIGSYIKLEKAGVNLRARCPFHNEKTPSFFVSPVRGSFYCFGCGEKGDVFNFVQKLEGVDFLGALKILADKAGVPLVFEQPEKKDEKEKLYSVLEEASLYYEKNLSEHEKAKEYLKDRGLDPKISSLFRLGYAKNEWRDVKKYLEKKGFKEADIEKAGLIKKPDGSEGKEPYDRFRGRIMFPITDSIGRIIGFSGRIFDTVPGETEPAKYINSPETPLFSKSKILYGFALAKEGIRKWGFSILVEGQMDLLMSHQAGFRNTVALSGTALTSEHITLLTRLSNNLVLALDSDTAGLNAAGRGAQLALSRGMDVKAARLKEGKDPADLVKTDPELWKKAVRDATHIIDFYLAQYIEKITDKRKLRQMVSSSVLPYVARIEKAIDRAHFIEKVAQSLRVPEAAVGEEVEILRKNLKNEEGSAGAPLSKGDTQKSPQEKAGDFGVILDTLLGLLIAETNFKKQRFNKEEVESKIEKVVGENTLRDMQKSATVREHIFFKGEQLYEEHENLPSFINDLILRLTYGKLREDFENLMHELRVKESEGNSKEAAQILEECQKLSVQIAKLDLDLKN